MTSGRRREETLATEAFIDATANEPGVLLIEGEAGIGKTTLWETGIARAVAHGYRVATARIGRPETALSFAAIGDLCDGLEQSAVDDLPPPQSAALNVALLRAPATDTTHDLRAVALATLSMLRSLAAERPVLVALDDIQWLDPASAQVISFVVRRLRAERVGFVVTRRVGEEAAASDDDFEHAVPQALLKRLELRPLRSGEISALVREKLRHDLPHSVAMKIHEMTAGNPFFALEVARQVIRDGVPPPGSPLPLPRDRSRVLRRRIAALAPETRAALEVVAAAARPTIELLRQALPDDSAAVLTEAERAGVVTVRAGRVYFAHPLFSTAVAALSSPPEWRAVHRRIAGVVTDPEERARHLALSATGPDVEIAAALDAAAVSARRRGAAASAAELASLAREFTPDGDAVTAGARAITAAMFAFDAGDASAAHRVLEDAIEDSPAGPERAAMMNRVCEISWQDTLRVERFARLALAEGGEASPEAAGAHASLAWVWIYRGELGAAARHSASAREAITGRDVDGELHSDVLTINALSSFLEGEPYDALVDEAVARQSEAEAEGPTPMGPIYSSARVVRGLTSLWAGDLSAARRWLEDELAVYESLGRYVARDELLCYLAELECRSGEWKKAEAYAEECLEIGEESGHLLGRGQNIMPRAWVSALVGDVAAARSRAEEGLELSLRYCDLLAAAGNRGVLGFADLSEGKAAEAAEHLRPVVHFLRDMGTTEPGLLPFVGDAVEALVACGELEEAEEIAGDDRLMGRLSRRPEAIVGTTRVPGLLLAARGNPDAALSSLADAVVSPAAAEQPFELARNLLVKGEVERRARRHAKARDDLQEAVAILDGLGATLWAERARTALGRVGSAATSAQELSPTERRLAALVADGKTNREAADLLFVSVKTVEANLSRIYRKLGVRSRAELVRRLVSDPTDDASPR